MLTATEIARRVTARELAPAEVLQECLDRITARNPELNAVVTLNPEAMDEAREVERRVAAGETLLLAGVPVGIKDVTQVRRLRTTFGSPLFKDHVSEDDALVVRRLRAAGAVIVGKTNTPEFAAGGNTWNDVFGRTRNPWNPAKSAGGSTGGGAVALATGMIALAEGTDLGGSLRIPASFCGVVGLRPSPGLVPTYPAGWVWDTLQVTGTMGRTAEDIALSLQAIAGAAREAPLAQPTQGRDFVRAVREGPGPRPRIAYCPDIGRIGIEPAVESVCRAAVDTLAKNGAEVEVIAFDLSEGRDAFLALRGHWFVSWMQQDIGRIDEFGINVRNNMKAGMTAAPGDVGRAEAVRGRIWHQFREFFERYDYLLTPTMAVPPFPVEQNYPETVAGRKMATYVDWLAPTFLLSLTGLPVASVPCGLDPDGMPVGLQIVAPPRGEEAALALAAVVQRQQPLPELSRAMD